MKTAAIGCGVVLVLVLILVFTLIGGYNRLVNLQQGVDRQWAQVQNVYQRRADLVPNLVSTVSGAANFEKTTLENVINARASVGRVNLNPGAAPTDPNQLAEFQRAQDSLSSALSRLLVVVEQYPQLRANQNFLELQAQLEGTENRIAVERGRFNEVVQQYNTAVRRFPTVLYAAMLGFTQRPYFSATAGADRPPEVRFDFSKQPATAPAR